MNIRLSVLLILFMNNAFSVDILLNTSSELNFNANSGVFTFAIISGIDCDSSGNAGINSFTCPGGLTECTVDQDTTFNLDWDVTSVTGCTATNTTNHPSWNSTVQPYGGGTGVFSKSISGGISSNTTFTLNCPASSIISYSMNVSKIETDEIILPENSFYNFLAYREISFITEIENANTSKNSISNFVNNNSAYFAKASVGNMYDYKPSIPPVKSKLESNQKVWYVLTDYLPKNNIIQHAYDGGKCDSIGYFPTINVSTIDIDKLNLLKACSIKPNKKYYLSKIIFTEKE